MSIEGRLEALEDSVGGICAGGDGEMMKIKESTFERLGEEIVRLQTENARLLKRLRYLEALIKQIRELIR